MVERILQGASSLAAVACLIGIAAQPALAQQGGSPLTYATGFQFEVHGGSASAAALNTIVGSQMPSAGFTFPDFRGGQSRVVPSWFFGDGTVLANQVTAQTGDGVKLVALDPILTQAGANRQTGGTFGIRLGHTITRHVLVEFAYDTDSGHLAIDPAAKAAIQASVASFSPYWTALLTRPSTTNVQTSASDTITDSVGKAKLLTFDVAINIVTIHRWTPYVEFGGGLSIPSPNNDAATVAITGHYQANAFTGVGNNTVLLSQTDQVSIQWQARVSAVKIFGGGVEGLLTNHLGVRVDIRGIQNANDIRTRLDTAPTTVAGPPVGVLARGVNPSLQIANNGLPSSLSVPLNKFFPFEAMGRLTTFSAGVFLRF